MFNRLSVNGFLKLVIGLLASAVIAVLGLGAWNSWDRLQTVNRISAVTEASAYMFTALHNLRLDRTFTIRELNAEAAATANPQAVEARASTIPALKGASDALGRVDFVGQGTTLAFDEAIKKLKRAAGQPPRRQAAQGAAPADRG